jgi:ribosomal protein L37E
MSLKKNEADEEKNEELNTLLRRIKAATSFDLEACEFSIRDAVLALGARFLEQALKQVGCGRRAVAIRCQRCGAVMASVGVKYKILRSILGRVRFGRSLFICPRCGRQRFPADEELGIEHIGAVRPSRATGCTFSSTASRQINPVP